MRIRSLAVATVAAATLLTGCTANEPGRTVPSPTSAEMRLEPTPEPSTEAPTVEQVEVPNVVGMDGLQAQRQIEDAGLRLDGTAEGDPTDVASQDPAAGTVVDAGSTVALELVPPAVVDHEVEVDGQAIYVWVESTITHRDAWLITRDLAQNGGLDEGGYFVQFNCTEGNTDSAWNRQANGKIAIGERGSVQTGLNAGAFQSELLEGATCP